MIHANYRDWRLVFILLFPGRVLHELTHAVVGERFAETVGIDWAEPAVYFEWDHASRTAVWATHLAPLVGGWLVGVAVVWALASGVVSASGGPLTLWLFANWLWYTAASAADLAVIREK